MKALMLAAALALPAAAFAQQPAQAPRDEASFHAKLFARYCDKLRASPEAYVLFVKRMKPIHGYTFTDFAPENRGDAVKADCKVSWERVAAVHEQLRMASR